MLVIEDEERVEVLVSAELVRRAVEEYLNVKVFRPDAAVAVLRVRESSGALTSTRWKLELGRLGAEEMEALRKLKG